MNNVFLTVDIEEWYDLDYLKKYNLDKDLWQAIPKIFDFLDILDSEGVKATFFVLANVLDKNADIVRDISSRGHEIACHGLNHDLLYNKSNDLFYKEIVDAKNRIEDLIGREIYGYRASCFSMDREKLDLVEKAGYRYDSSKISFKQHPLYRDLDLTGFKKVDDLVYKKDDFYEYEIPTLAIGKYSVPISGGGYLRLLPYSTISYLIKRYEKSFHNFLLYFHPFELTFDQLPSFSNKIKVIDLWRIKIGQKKNLHKVNKLIKKFNKKANLIALNEDRLTREKYCK